MEPFCVRELPPGFQSAVDYVTDLDRTAQSPVLPSVSSITEEFLGADPADGSRHVLSLVAEAGCGKSSVLHRLGQGLVDALGTFLKTPLVYVQEIEGEIWTPWIPVLVELKRYSARDLHGLLPRLLTGSCGLPAESVHAMRDPRPGQPRVRLLLLCDGMDELRFDAPVEDLVTTLCGPGWTPSHVKIIATYRASAFQDVGRERHVFGDGYARWLLLPFSASQVGTVGTCTPHVLPILYSKTF